MARFILPGVLVIIGCVVVGIGWQPLTTGANAGGWLGRGITRGDKRRLKRAPSSYFRAVGAMGSVLGVLLVFNGVVLALLPDRPTWLFVVGVITVECLLILAEALCLGYLIALAARHRLFRWNKP